MGRGRGGEPLWGGGVVGGGVKKGGVPGRPQSDVEGAYQGGPLSSTIDS